MADVFVSYKSDDRPAVQPLVQGLRGHGLEVWWDKDIAPDDPWELTIERELREARAVVVAWSTAAVVSENVKAEARLAWKLGKLVQVYIEPCDPPLFFGERQGVGLHGWSGDTADRRFVTVVEAARAVAAGRTPPKGVGYTPLQRRKAWPPLVAAVSGTTLAAVAGVTIFGGVLQTKPTPTNAAESAAGAAQARQTLLRSLVGAWDRRSGACASPMTINVATDANGVTLITVTSANNFHSVSQVSTAADGVIDAWETTPGVASAGMSEYRPSGAIMTVKDAQGVTTLKRCPTPA